LKRRFARGGVDFFSGLLLAAIASVAIIYIWQLEIGTTREMGPGFFPLGIAAILFAMGLFLCGRGVLVEGAAVDAIHLRPLGLILLSFLAFAVLVDRFGLIAAILAQVAVANFASTETSLLQSILFGFLLAAFSSVVFVWLLGIPVGLLP
jgi:Tripartite tricarboxylate transporter TctB family